MAGWCSHFMTDGGLGNDINFDHQRFEVFFAKSQQSSLLVHLTDKGSDGGAAAEGHKV